MPHLVCLWAALTVRVWRVAVTQTVGQHPGVGEGRVRVQVVTAGVSWPPAPGRDIGLGGPARGHHRPMGGRGGGGAQRGVVGQAACALLVNEEGVDPEVEQLAIANIARPENRIIEC